MPQRLGRVLISREEIAHRVEELGRAVAREHAGRVPLLVGVLKGAVIFMADLVRAIRAPIAMDFMGVSSYGPGTRSAGSVRLTADLSVSIEGRAVVIVEDIVDTGLTLTYLQEILRARGPKALRTACLLSKPSRRQVDVKVEYIGFTIEDRFVVGYGLDYAERYRNLPYIAVVE